MKSIITIHSITPTGSQANTFDARRDQQGFFTYLHKWIVIVEQRSQLDDIALILGNVANVIALAPTITTHHIQQVWKQCHSTGTIHHYPSHSAGRETMS